MEPPAELQALLRAGWALDQLKGAIRLFRHRRYEVRVPVVDVTHAGDAPAPLQFAGVSCEGGSVVSLTDINPFRDRPPGQRAREFDRGEEALAPVQQGSVTEARVCDVPLQVRTLLWYSALGFD